MDKTDLVNIPEHGGLDEFAPETPSPNESGTSSLMSVVRADVSPETGTPRPFSRVESAQAKRATSLVTTRNRQTVSSVTTRCGRNITLVAVRIGHAVSSVATRGACAASSVAIRSGRTISSAATRSGRAVSSLASRSAAAVVSAATNCAHLVSSLSRALLGYAWTVVALLALRCDSWSHAAARTVRASRSRVTSLRPDTTPAPAGDLRDLESEGSFVAAALALAVVSYGGLLLLSWRDPLPRISVAASAVTAPAAALGRGTPAAVPPTRMATNSAPARAGDPAPLDSASANARPVGARLSTASLRAVWSRSDTRSLQGALTNLRRQTLALHRCGMKVTAADSAVARCDGSSSATYTIDFRRIAERWVIQRVSSR